jgi:hypothetical protein
MRMEFVLAGAVTATIMAMSAGVTVAGSDECCGEGLPKVVYALPPTPSVIPPTGYVLDPSDAAKPVYPVGPRPYVAGYGAAPYARPTYSEGGYAYADSYPYSDDPYGYGQGHGAGLASGPPGYAAPAYDPPGPGFYQGLYVRPAGVPPYTAYRYRVAPGAKIIHLLPRD